MQVESHLKKYLIKEEKKLNFIEKLFEIENAKFVVDMNIYKIYNDLFSKIPTEKICIIEATEENKTIETALEICEQLTDIPAKRNTTLISVGGGIIQDITGFVANIMYRGIKWIFVPTTLLSACDSCIGGKTSLNYKKYKNLLGTFYPPNEIHICSEFFKSLSEHDFKSGLGEIIKFNIMSGRSGLENIENNIEGLLARDNDMIHRFILSSLNFKKNFIEVDEFDRGERVKLNFAHTFGHAIEVITEYKIPHGTAVAVGMIMADYVSYTRGLISEDIVRRSERVLLQVIDVDVESLNKPVKEYINIMRKDKKQIDDSLTAVLITNYDDLAELTVVHDILEKEIDEAVKYFVSLYKKRC